MMVKPISRAPFSAAWNGFMPFSTCRAMFSITTMASSTTKPLAMVSAIMVRLFRLKPIRCITARVPTSDSGTETLAITVACGLPRNRKMASVTSATANSSSICTSCTEARMPSVRSVSSVTWTSAGSVSSSCGSAALMASTVAMTFAPGWRWTSTMMAGVSFIQAPRRLFSEPSTTLATSFRRTGAPAT